LSKADLVICDSVGFGKYQDFIQGSGKPLLGCDPIFDEMHEDRRKAVTLLKHLAIAMPSEDDIERAPDLLNEGVLLTVEGWWNGGKWMLPWIYTINEQTLFPRKRGPLVESMGSMVIAKHRKSKLIENTIERTGSFMKKVGYKGPVSMDLLVTADNILALAFKGGFTYDSIEAVIEGMAEPVTNALFETATGIRSKFDTKPFVLASVRLTIPPWPYATAGGAWLFDTSVKGINQHNLKHLFLQDIKKIEDRYELSGGTGVVLKATAAGVDHFEARRRACRTLDRLTIMNKQYRYDIGTGFDKDMGHLKEWGWIT